MTLSRQSDPATNIAIRISVALVFTLTGLDKFLQSPEWDQVFKAIGWGDWFRYFTGIVEMAGGLMFLLPSTTTVGAALLTAAMIGVSHLIMFACILSRTSGPWTTAVIAREEQR